MEGALDFLTYSTSEEQVKFMMDKFGYISANQSIAETQFEADSPYQPFVEELKYAMPVNAFLAHHAFVYQILNKCQCTDSVLKT